MRWTKVLKVLFICLVLSHNPVSADKKLPTLDAANVLGKEPFAYSFATPGWATIAKDTTSSDEGSECYWLNCLCQQRMVFNYSSPNTPVWSMICGNGENVSFIRISTADVGELMRIPKVEGSIVYSHFLCLRKR